ncbi:winged helix DNA-binding domain-containing protein [Nocardioides sp. GY 10113]|uniref:winged helix DNA-binding domain-containing protein n=1 Tax=Nocardioides sp. GY 10113 TaxID=2569761 RepID=UPI0010A86648|nr:winged helix DNA-binding domain-containing protein [Nocardioides sp. GY 10113]TIC87944.1 winged helix DNA-binding domain-containing protein [Nocardioides sp. GY 10113]
MRHIDDAERRARLGRRHGLAHPFPDVVAAARGLTALHATEAATVHLALWARVPGISVADVDAALYDDRSIVKQLAMRRTLFAFPVEALPAVWGSAAARVAQQQRAQLAKDVASAGLAEDPGAWLDATCAAVLDVLSDGRARTAAELREEVPALAGRITRGTPGKKWAAELPIGPNVLTALGAAGRIVRGANAGHWRLNKPTWLATADWLGETPTALPAAAGYAELVRGWLRGFGPGTEDDLVWWLGATKTLVRAALAEVGAVEVGLDGGVRGWVLPDDVDPVAAPRPWVALLPTLDPTVMGWKGRDFYLDAADRPFLFDSNGNAGNTAWCDGRIVGAWVQDDGGRVRLLLRSDPGAAARRELEAAADRLTSWLDGVRIVNVYASPQMKGVALR